MIKLNYIVSNSSPIIGLSKIGQLHLVWDIFEEVFIPRAVYNEIVSSSSKNISGKIELIAAIEQNKIKIYDVVDFQLVNKLYGKLHKGELETIIAARELGIDTVLLDERAARNLAETFSIDPLGTLGLLKLAKALDVISEIKPFIDLLIQNNYRISKKIYNQIILDSGE